jgi:hypothetical protein
VKQVRLISQFATVGVLCNLLNRVCYNLPAISQLVWNTPHHITGSVTTYITSQGLLQLTCNLPIGMEHTTSHHRVCYNLHHITGSVTTYLQSPNWYGTHHITSQGLLQLTSHHRVCYNLPAISQLVWNTPHHIAEFLHQTFPDLLSTGKWHKSDCACQCNA